MYSVPIAIERKQQRRKTNLQVDVKEELEEVRQYDLFGDLS